MFEILHLFDGNGQSILASDVVMWLWARLVMMLYPVCIKLCNTGNWEYIVVQKGPEEFQMVAAKHL